MTRPERIAPHITLGRTGEDVALALLQKKGMRLLARNWRPQGIPRNLELDVVGEQDGVILFVEVKTRRRASPIEQDVGPSFSPEDNFTQRKRKNFVRAAQYFLSAFDLWRKPCRFDLVCVTFLPQGPPKLEHHVHVIKSGPFVDRSDAAWQPW